MFFNEKVNEGTILKLNWKTIESYSEHANYSFNFNFNFKYANKTYNSQIFLTDLINKISSDKDDVYKELKISKPLDLTDEQFSEIIPNFKQINNSKITIEKIKYKVKKYISLCHSIK